MNAIQRMVRYIGDSPTYGRDRANLISGGTIGVAGLLLNLSVLMLVLPLMLDADDPGFRLLTENLEFGQLLALILLGGATAFATLLVPLRMISIFWGPRIGRYFDQIVLSGISPLKFVIGKATSQNLFLALILFLLLPYLVLSLTLGGVNLVSFVAGLFLVWLYCIALALATLWASLYLNELLAALQVISWSIVLIILGCIPMQPQPFVLTPLPALLQPVYASIPDSGIAEAVTYWPTFGKCVLGMTAVIGVSLLSIHLGPLFGIIRENSTFGEVVREGDNKRKRWSRLRQHIQRPSEIAFFYENRSVAFRRREGLLRWGLAFGSLALLMAGMYGGYAFLTSKSLPGPGRWQWFVFPFHVFYLTIHGFVICLAVVVFSHAKNTTFLRVPLAFGRSAEVARLDTIGFLLCLLLTTGASIATPFLFDRYFAGPVGETVFAVPQRVGIRADFVRVALEGSRVIAVAGLVIYAFQRLVCLNAWMRFSAFMTVGMLYFILVCLVPLLVYVFVNDSRDLRPIEPLVKATQQLAMMSPMTVLIWLFGETPRDFPRNATAVPFYASHAVLLVILLFAIHRRSPRLRGIYLEATQREAAQ